MINNKNKDPLHGVTLKMILIYLIEKLDWEDMSQRIRINCFAKDPSIKSSLSFLRKTPWARKKVERLYLIEKSNTSKKSERLYLKRGVVNGFNSENHRRN